MDLRQGVGYYLPLPKTNDQEGEEPYQQVKHGIYPVSPPSSLPRAGLGRKKTYLANDPIEPGAPQYRISTPLELSSTDGKFVELTLANIASTILAINASSTR